MKTMKAIIFILLLIPAFCQAQFFGLNQNLGGEEQIIKYGYLYNRYAYEEAVSGNQISSSSDWVPITRLNWDTLDLYIGGDGASPYNDFDDYMAVGTTYWNLATGIDTYGLNLRGCGYRDATGPFLSITSAVHMIAVTTFGAYLSLTSSGTTPGISNGGNQQGRTVILTKDATGLSDGETTTYTGNDDKQYNAIVIDERYFITTPLAETKFRDDSWITGYDGGVYTPISNANWQGKTTEALCAYSDDENNVFE